MTYSNRQLKCNVFDVQLVADDDGNAGAGIGIGGEKISGQTRRYWKPGSKRSG